MTDEQRLSNLKQKVSELKTDLAIKEDRKEKLLEELKEYFPKGDIYKSGDNSEFSSTISPGEPKPSKSAV